jgi:uncharacterized membrane protein (UPF0127 family)
MRRPDELLEVHNQTRDISLVDRGKVANNAWTRFKGLIGVRELPDGDGLAIVPSSGVHCMFMSIPIDVIYVDKTDRVVALDLNMKPWTVGRPHRGAHYVIELPAGTISRTGTQVGDQLRVSY